MLRAAILFLILATVAALFGFTGLAGTASSIAQVLFFVLIALFLIGLGAVCTAFVTTQLHVIPDNDRS